MHIFCLPCQISTRLAEEKATLLKQCEESVSAKTEETEQLKLQLEEAQQELLLTKNQVCFTGLQLFKRFIYLTINLLLADVIIYIIL